MKKNNTQGSDFSDSVLSIPVHVIDAATSEVVRKCALEQAQFVVADRPDADLWLPGIPELSIDRKAENALMLNYQGQSKPLEFGSGFKLANGWRLSFVRDPFCESGAKLCFEGPIEQGDDLPSNAARTWRMILMLVIVLVISLPFWVPQFDSQPAPSASENTSSEGLANTLEPMLSPGPLHPAHANATQACSDCHQESFSSIQIEPCLSCHTMKRHLTQAQTGVHPLCVACHKEHEGIDPLITRDQRLCTQCHQNHETLKGVLAEGVSVTLDVIAGFPNSHPKFAPENPYREQAVGLKFSHKQHLQAKLKRANKRYAPLDCAACHLPDDRGHGFKPITMEGSCGGECHALQRVTEQGLQTVEHGNLLALFENVEPQNRFQIVEASCGDCHTLPSQRIVDSAEWSQWAQTQALPKTRFKAIRFSHKRHEGGLQCIDCHAEADNSEAVTDLLLPTREACATCHQSETHDDGMIKTPCASCHYFHTVDWE